MQGDYFMARNNIIEQLLASLKGNLSQISDGDFDKAIKSLKNARTQEQIEEQKERERKEKEEKERQEKAHIEQVTSMDLPMDWDNVFDTDERASGVHYDSIPDALIHCLSTLGCVDIEYIASITGQDYKTVINTLKGSIYQNPDTWEECFYKGWETSDEYLSGNLMRKWKAAKSANKKYKGYFKENMLAIEKVLPPSVAAEDIFVTLGSPWVPADVIDDFIEHLFGSPLQNWYGSTYQREVLYERMKTIHDEVNGTWEIPEKSRYMRSVATNNTYGTARLGALYILEKTLNMKSVSVKDEVSCPTNKSGVKRVINKAETVAALEKQQRLIEEFQKWIWTDKARKERLEKIFENKYSSVRRRIFDGSFLTFPGMNQSIELYPYQKNAVARIIFTPNTLLAHDVGAGKTYIMIAAGQEMRRMGISKKNMYVVPNNIVGQWKNIFLEMYPNAKLLCIEPKTFTAAKREKVLQRIVDEDFDGIIIASSCFEEIPLSKDYYVSELEAKKKELNDIIQQKGKVTTRLTKKKKQIEEDLAKLVVSVEEASNKVYFDDLGITRLFVDEAHNYKNVPIETKVDKVLGISATGSKKCQDMMDKVHLVQKNNNGKGVVMSTGTPITNSITDIYVMQLYLQSGELALLDLQSFDSWVGMFAEKKTEFEIDVDTSSYRLATRFSKFHNLPELTALISTFADFHSVDEGFDIPECDGYSDSLIAKTDEFAEYLETISARAENVRKGHVSRTDDNMLKITTDGRKAALDMRLVDQTQCFTYQSKVARCAENVADIYFKTEVKKSTQLIFCDSSTPKDGFNIYDELKDRLLYLGVPREAIAYIHDAATERQRTALFKKVCKGEIRILIGSTFKLGLGVNVQEKLIAIHHIDIPWRPADMTQREGRILRQGNENDKVKIFRYITEGSFDAYSWQLLETKQRFISDLLSGSISERSGSDIEDTVLSYAEVKALAVGNPLVKERVETANELTKYLTLQRKLIETKSNLEKELLELPAKIDHQKELISECEDDWAYYSQWLKEHPQATDNKAKKDENEQRKVLREHIALAVQNNEMQENESVLMDFNGFELVLPAKMTLEKPYVWLKRTGKYYLELGSTEIGNLIRIENFLEGLGEHLEKLKAALKKHEKKQADIKAELAKNESYADEIEQCKAKIKKLDKELGVDKDE